MFCNPLGLAITLIQGKYNAQWVNLPSVLSVQVPFTVPGSLNAFSGNANKSGNPTITYVYHTGSSLCGHLYTCICLFPVINTALYPNVTLMKQHTSALSSSTYPSLLWRGPTRAEIPHRAN